MRSIFTMLLGLLLALPMSAQRTKFAPSDWGLLDGKTMIKANITSPIFRNYSFAMERILTRGLGAQLASNVMTMGQLPLVSATGALGLNEEWESAFNLSSFSLTPELRWYTGGGYGHGFYLMTYYRYEQYKFKDYGYEFNLEGPPSGRAKGGQAVLRASIDTHSVGLGLGAQWLFGHNKNIILDWNIVGAHVGRGEINAEGTYHLNNGEKFSHETLERAGKELLNPLSELAFIDLKQSRAEVDDASNTLRLKGLNTPWAFFRMSISVGFRF